MTTTITREFGWDMGHMLPDHEGGCYRPHGHRYRAEITITGPGHDEGPERGMVRDFAALAAAVREYVIDQYDHRFMVAADDPRAEGMRDLFGDAPIVVVGGPPTAENLARWIGHHLDAVLAPCRVVSVRLWETPNCSAEWRP